VKDCTTPYYELYILQQLLVNTLRKNLDNSFYIGLAATGFGMGLPGALLGLWGG